MEPNKTVTMHSLNYQIEQLQREKEELKKQACKDAVKKMSQLVFDQNSEEPLSLREIENLLNSFVYDIKGILED